MKAHTPHINRKTRIFLCVAAGLTILSLITMTRAYFAVRLELVEARSILADMVYDTIHRNANENTPQNRGCCFVYVTDLGRQGPRNVHASCAFHASWTTMTKTGAISTRSTTDPLEAPLWPGAPAGVIMQHTTSHLVFYGHVTGAATQSTSIMLDSYGIWRATNNISGDLVDNMPEGR